MKLPIAAVFFAVSLGAGLLTLLAPWDAASTQRFRDLQAAAMEKEVVFIADAGSGRLVAATLGGQRLWQRPWSGSNTLPSPGLVALADGGVLAVTDGNTALRLYDGNGSNRGVVVRWDPARTRMVSFGVAGDTLWYTAVRGDHLTLTRRPLVPISDAAIEKQTPSLSLVVPEGLELIQAFPRGQEGLRLIGRSGTIWPPLPLVTSGPVDLLPQGAGFLLLDRVEQSVLYWQTDQTVRPVTVYTPANLVQRGEVPRFASRLGNSSVGTLVLVDQDTQAVLVQATDGSVLVLNETTGNENDSLTGFLGIVLLVVSVVSGSAGLVFGLQRVWTSRLSLTARLVAFLFPLVTLFVGLTAADSLRLYQSLERELEASHLQFSAESGAVAHQAGRSLPEGAAYQTRRLVAREGRFFGQDGVEVGDATRLHRLALQTHGGVADSRIGVAALRDATGQAVGVWEVTAPPEAGGTLETLWYQELGAGLGWFLTLGLGFLVLSETLIRWEGLRLPLRRSTVTGRVRKLSVSNWPLYGAFRDYRLAMEPYVPLDGLFLLGKSSVLSAVGGDHRTRRGTLLAFYLRTTDLEEAANFRRAVEAVVVDFGGFVVQSNGDLLLAAAPWNPEKALVSLRQFVGWTAEWGDRMTVAIHRGRFRLTLLQGSALLRLVVHSAESSQVVRLSRDGGTGADVLLTEPLYRSLDKKARADFLPGGSQTWRWCTTLYPKESP